MTTNKDRNLNFTSFRAQLHAKGRGQGYVIFFLILGLPSYIRYGQL